MSRTPPARASRGVEALLFWTMLTIGGGLLAAALLVEPLLAYDAQRLRTAQAVAATQQVQADIEQCELQITYLEHDPDYVARLAQTELNQAPRDAVAINLVPETDTGPGKTSVSTELMPLADASPNVPEPHVLKQLAAWIVPLGRDSALVSVLVLPHTRPVVLGLAWLLVGAALMMMLSRPRGFARRA